MEKQNKETLQRNDNIEAKRISFPVAAIYYEEIEAPYTTIMVEKGWFTMFLIWAATTFLQFWHFDWSNFGSAMMSSTILLMFTWLPWFLISTLLDKILRKHNLRHYIKEHRNAEGMIYLIEYHNKNVKYQWQKISNDEIRKLFAN